MRHAHDEEAVGTQHARDLGHDRLFVGHMLVHIEQNNGVDMGVGVGQALGRAKGKAGAGDGAAGAGPAGARPAGRPGGGDLEYADEVTRGRAFEARRLLDA